MMEQQGNTQLLRGVTSSNTRCVTLVKNPLTSHNMKNKKCHTVGTISKSNHERGKKSGIVQIFRNG